MPVLALLCLLVTAACTGTLQGHPPGAGADADVAEAEPAADAGPVQPLVDACRPGPAADPRARCAASVCDALPACCSDRWDEACVLEALLSCEDPCPATGLHALEPAFASSAPASPPVGRVQPVLVVPSDLRTHPDVPFLSRLLGGAAQEGQGLLAAATGQTFALDPVLVVDGSQTNASYHEGGGVEARRAAIEASGRGDDRDRILWIVWFGGGGYAGAYGEAPGFDFELSAMVGSGSLFTHLAHVTDDLRWCDHILEEGFADECRRRSWVLTAGLGGFVHELGHSLGLGHENDHDATTPATSIMSAHWSYFEIRSPARAAEALSEPYQEIVRASRFTAPAP